VILRTPSMLSEGPPAVMAIFIIVSLLLAVKEVVRKTNQ
jgi:hypothetical protein